MAIEIAEKYLDHILHDFDYLEGIILVDKEGVDIYSSYARDGLKES